MSETDGPDQMQETDIHTDYNVADQMNGGRKSLEKLTRNYTTAVMGGETNAESGGTSSEIHSHTLRLNSGAE
jgi:hypothetical protein